MANLPAPTTCSSRDVFNIVLPQLRSLTHMPVYELTLYVS